MTVPIEEAVEVLLEHMQRMAADLQRPET